MAYQDHIFVLLSTFHWLWGHKIPLYWSFIRFWILIVQFDYCSLVQSISIALDIAVKYVQSDDQPIKVQNTVLKYCKTSTAYYSSYTNTVSYVLVLISDTIWLIDSERILYSIITQFTITCLVYFILSDCISLSQMYVILIIRIHWWFILSDCILLSQIRYIILIIRIHWWFILFHCILLTILYRDCNWFPSSCSRLQDPAVTFLLLQ